ncbi:unnamed protein product [Musa textilis]
MLPTLLILASLALPSSSSLAALSTTLHYHNGSLLSSPINIYTIWYGSFTAAHRAAISDFFASFRSSPSPQPTVSKWWSTVQQYKDYTGKPVSATVEVAAQTSDRAYSLGRSLTRSNIANLVRSSVAKGLLPLDAAGVYMVLTSSDVTVGQFCTSSCGFHSTVLMPAGKRVVMVHVGDPGTQCPGLCAWPYAAPEYGPPGPTLVAPNGVGVDGTVINIATVIAGAVTNPFRDGYYQGDRLAPLEVATACAGIFGEGAYPGNPGNLLIDEKSEASFNAFGAGGRRFLLPAIWEPISGKCKKRTRGTEEKRSYSGCCASDFGGLERRMQQPQFILQLQRVTGLIPDPLHPSAGERLVGEPVHLQDLIVPKVESAIHLLEAALHGIIPKLAARLAADEVGDEGPAMVAKARVVVLDHLLVAVNKDAPVTVEVVGALEVDLVSPPVTLGDKEVDHGGLVVGLEYGAVLEEGGEDLARLGTGLALGAHGRPDVEEVERPLAVAEEETAGVEADPVAVVVDHLIPAVQNEVEGGVALPGELEGHIGEHGVAVHPPQELHLRMGEEERADQGQLGPEARHLGVEEGHVVEDLDAVDAAVVDLVLDGLEKVVVAHRVLAGLRGGSRHQEDARLSGAQKARPLRVAAEPVGALLVPIGDLGAQGVGHRRIAWRILLLFGAVGIGMLRLLLSEGAVGVMGMAVEEAADVVEVLLRRAEAAGADGTAEDNDGHDEAEQGQPPIAKRPMQLPHPPLPQAPPEHRHPLLLSLFSPSSSSSR